MLPELQVINLNTVLKLSVGFDYFHGSKNLIQKRLFLRQCYFPNRVRPSPVALHRGVIREDEVDRPPLSDRGFVAAASPHPASKRALSSASARCLKTEEAAGAFQESAHSTVVFRC